MSFEDTLTDLAQCCSDILSSAKSLDINVSDKITNSLKNCSVLLGMYFEDKIKRPLVMKNIAPFFKQHYKNFTVPVMEEVDGVNTLQSIDWLYPVGDPDKTSGHRGLCICPNMKRPKICIPLSEIFDIATEIVDKDEEKDYWAPRLIYLFLMCMSKVECEGDNGELMSTEDVLLSAVDLEPLAKISGDELLKNLKNMGVDADSASQLLKQFSGKDMDQNKILSFVSEAMKSYNVDGMGSIMKIVQNLMGGGSLDGATDPDDQE